MTNPIDRAIEECGGLSNLAIKLGATTNQITNWRLRRVPTEFCAALEQATNGKVTRKELRPDDWETIWPELKD